MLVDVESLLEYDYCVGLEFDLSVLRFESQPPVDIDVRRGSQSYPVFPDFLVTFLPAMGLKPSFVDVMPVRRLAKKWDYLRPRLRAVARYAHEHDMTYRLRIERKIRTPFFYNCRRLLPYLRDDPEPEHEASFLNAISVSTKTSFGELLDLCFGNSQERAEAARTLWTLIAHRKILCDLDLPIDESSFAIWPNAEWTNAKIA